MEYCLKFVFGVSLIIKLWLAYGLIFFIKVVFIKVVIYNHTISLCMFYFAKMFERNIVKKEKIPKIKLRKRKADKLRRIRQNMHWSLTLLEQRPRVKLQGHPSFSLIYKPLFNPSRIFSFAALTNTTMEDNHKKTPKRCRSHYRQVAGFTLPANDSSITTSQTRTAPFPATLMISMGMIWLRSCRLIYVLWL